MEPATEELPVIPGYRVTRRIGGGSMGVVYEAEELSLGRRVAVKVVAERISGDDKSLRRFEREARTLGTIEHENVVRVYFFGQCTAGPYLVMEYFRGGTLATKLTREGALPISEAMAITKQIVMALRAAWEKSVIHRDVKPSNVLIDARGVVKVADFGLAKPLAVHDEQTPTQSGAIVGSPPYMSPEQAQGLPVDFHSDVYSVGLILYEMLNGAPAFTGTTHLAILTKQVHEQLEPIENKRSGIPSHLASLIKRMTAKGANDRPASYDDILRELDAIDHSGLGEAAAALKTLRSRPRLRYAITPLVVAVALIVLTLLSLPERKHPAAIPHSTDGSIAIAVAPFFGPDDDSKKEGQVMAVLIEKEIKRRLPGEARVIGMKQTYDAVESREEAKALAERLHADVVIWGEVFSLRGESEIQPHVDFVSRPPPLAESRHYREYSEGWQGRLSEIRRNHAFSLFASRAEVDGDHAANVIRLMSTAPNQIELHRTSAAGVANVVAAVVGTHALYSENNPTKALEIFQRAPQTADTLRYQADALFRASPMPPQCPPPYAANADYLPRPEQSQQRNAAGMRQVRSLFDRAIALDPHDAQSYAMRADLLWELGEFTHAVDDYRIASQSGTPFTTRHAIFFDGKLFTPESFRSTLDGKGADLSMTATLLGLDPVSFRVAMRRPLPGVAASFRIAGRWLEITYAPVGEGSKIDASTIRFDGTNFDRPVCYDSDPLMRARTIMAGWVLAANFLDEFGDTSRDLKIAHFRPKTKDMSSDAPSTYADLETSLRRVIENDPTQPWHPFFLGMSLWAHGARTEAETAWNGCLARDEPGTPYYEYAWMSAGFLRSGHKQLADRAYALALAKRKAYPQPITGGSEHDRLISGPFEEAAALNTAAGSISLAEGYEWLRRARELGGLAPEGDDVVARGDDIVSNLWANRFEALGDHISAAAEREVARRVAADDSNMNARVALLVVSILVFIAAVAGLMFVFGAILLYLAKASFTKRPRKWLPGILVTFTLAGASVALIFVFVTTQSEFLSIASTATATCLVMGGAILLAGRKASFASSLATIPRSYQVTATVAVAVVALAAFSALAANLPADALIVLPHFTSDAIGSPAAVSFIDDVCSENPSGDCRYASAVAHHLAGDTQRARVLYASLPGDARAIANLDALNHASSLRATLTREDLLHAVMPSAWGAALAMLSARRTDYVWRHQPIHDGFDAAGPVIAAWGIVTLVVLTSLAITLRRPATSCQSEELQSLMHGRIALTYLKVMFVTFAVPITLLGSITLKKLAEPDYIDFGSPVPKLWPGRELFLAFPHSIAISSAAALALVAAILLHVADRWIERRSDRVSIHSTLPSDTLADASTIPQSDR